MLSLTAFVLYWNVLSYESAKENLRSEVEYQIQQAYSVVKDSFISKELILFIQSNDSFPSVAEKNDSITNRIANSNLIRSEGDIDSVELLLNTDTIIDFRYETYPRNDKIVLKTIIDSHHFAKDIAIIDLSEDSGIATYTMETDSNDAREINKTISTSIFDSLVLNDLNTIQESNNIISKIMIDGYGRDAKTYTILKENLELKGLPSVFEIVQDAKAESKGLRVRYSGNSFGLTTWIIDLISYEPYLVKKLLPNILFSLLLLGIVGLAFWTLISNWKRQQQLVTTRTEFINNMTHELKTPIATVGVALEAISNFDVHEDAEKTKEYVEISRHEISRLSLLVDKVLNMATLDNRGSDLHLITIDLNIVITEVLESMRLRFENEHADVSFSKTPDLYINGDALHLTNVIHNVLDNSLKYTKEDPKITIRTIADGNDIVIVISDNGPGIPKEHLDKVFDRFYRIPTDNIHDVKGHGLGLSYVSDVIGKHGGTIKAKSAAKQGTTIHMTIPKMTDV
jgi:signal transduction histidine kinase